MATAPGGQGQAAGAGLYPAPETLSYIAEVAGQRSFFPTDDAYCRAWFYPRYAGGALHEPLASRFLAESLTPESVFVDVGAHIGYFSVIAAQRARAVFAIEPQEALIGRIHRNVAANHLRNVHTIMAAAGDRTGFVAVPKSGTPSTGVKLAGSGNLVPMIRLDDYFTAALTPTHVKIDTEGFEFQVLKGMARILETRPLLLIEIHHDMDRYGAGVAEMLGFLQARGYELAPLRHRAEAGAALSLETVLGAGNAMVLCRPAAGA